MQFLDLRKLEAIDVEEFWAQKPFPWLNPVDLLYPEAFNILTAQLPDFKLFSREEGGERLYGQKPHNRYQLIYKKGLPIPAVWQEFINELNGRTYTLFVRRLFGLKWFDSFHLDFRWAFATKGDSVSPHCDGERKIGTHIFYLNTEDDWNVAWGGATLILDDRGSLNCESNPDFPDFKNEISTKFIGNASLIFVKTNNSWHGVKELICPEDKLRKIFNVAVEKKGSLPRRIVNRIKKHLRSFTQ